MPEVKLGDYKKIAKTELAKEDKTPEVTDKEIEDVIPLEHIIEIYQHIPKAQLFIMPGATHFMLRNNHVLFNQIVENFLNKPFQRPTTKEIILKSKL
jgi:alpha/beta superfamily hydrolase